MTITYGASEFDGRLDLTWLGYVVDNWTSAHKVYGPGGPMIDVYNEIFADMGLVALGTIPTGFGSITMSKGVGKIPTRFPEDAKGIKMRVIPSPLAIKRFQNVKGSIYTPKCFFWNISATDPNLLEILNGKDRGVIYDVVSCQFSIHYFISEIDITLNMISKKLRKGGLFVGTTVDGDLLFKNLKGGNINIPFLNVSKTTEKSYIYEITNNSESSKTESYYEYRGSLSEYFVFKEELIEKCKKHSLELVRMQNFHEWNEQIKTRLNLHEQIISYFNFSFVFLKI
jgi:hypothetical protein